MTRRWPRPPLMARALVSVWLRGEMRELVRGDLDQEFHEGLAAGTTRRAAAQRYWRQALASIAAARIADIDTPDTGDRFHMNTRTPRRLTAGLFADLRYVLRRLSASPGFAAVAILSLAIGIGANTAVASVARAALFTTLPVERPDELSFLYWTRVAGLDGMYMDGGTDPATGDRTVSNVSFPAYAALRRLTGPGVSIGAFTFIAKANVVVGGRPAESAGGVLVDGGYFNVVRPPMALGRWLTDADDRPGAEPLAVIGYDFWQRAALGSPSVLDIPIVVNGVPMRIAGVTGRGFRGLSPGGFRPTTDIALPLSLQPRVMASWTPAGDSLFVSPRIQWVRPIVRLAAPASADTFVDMAGSVLRAQVVGAGVADAARAATVHGVLVPAGHGINLDAAATRTSVVILGAVVGIVLLLTCLNLAGLMMARGVARRHEMSVRAALGASRWRLIRLALLESAVLTTVGAATGIALTFAGQPVLSSMLRVGLGPVLGDVAIDAPLLALTVALAGGSALLAGLLPALQLSGGRTTSGLAGRPGGTTAPRLVVGRVLLAIQIAVSVPLIAGAGLLLRTMYNLGHVDVGFNPGALLTFRVEAPAAAGGEAPAIVYDRILGRLREVPGVRSATLVENPLVSGVSSSRSLLVNGERRSVRSNAVGPDFFELLGVPLVAGRTLTDRDAEGPEHIVVNQTASRQLFGGAALGQRVRIPAPPGADAGADRDVEIVGVVADMAYTSLRAQPSPTIFDYYARHRASNLIGVTYMVRIERAPGSLERSIREAVAGVTPDIAVTAFRTQAEQIDQTIGRERVFARLLSLFGAFALLLASIGLHGVTSYAVARRTSEIGVRVALGARGDQIRWLIMRHVLWVALIGLAVGVPIAIAAGSLVKSMLFGLAAADPLTLAAAGATMLAVMLLAGWLPARRAARLDPLAAIRKE